MSDNMLDGIVIDSDKQFRMRLIPALRRLRISQIKGTKDYLDIEFIGGESFRILYPSNFESFPDVIESELLLQTQLSMRSIDNIKYFVRDYLDDIKNFLKELD
jgi:hypothetical protein